MLGELGTTYKRTVHRLAREHQIETFSQQPADLEACCKWRISVFFYPALASASFRCFR